MYERDSQSRSFLIREERVMMKITGVLVDMIIQLDPQLYGPHVVYE